MSLFPLRRSAGVAVCLAALALLAPLKGADITFDCGSLTTTGKTTTAQAQVRVDFPVVIYVGCPATLSGVVVVSSSGSTISYSVVGALGKATTFASITPNCQLSSDTAPKDLATSQTFTWFLRRGTSTIIDTGSFTASITGSIRHDDGGTNVNTTQTFTGPKGYIWLKDSGPVAGKTRGPANGGVVPAPVGQDKLNVISMVPTWATNDQGQVYNPTVPNYTIGTKTGSFGAGSNWMQVSVDHGSVTGVPSWFSSAFPGAISFTSEGSTYIVGAFGRSFTGGSGTQILDGNGASNVSVWGTGFANQLDLQFPPSFKPPVVDASTPTTVPDYSQVDACFVAGMTDLGLSTAAPSPTGSPPVPGTLANQPSKTPTLPGGTGGGTAISGPSNGIGSGATGGGTVKTPTNGVGGTSSTGGSGFVSGSGGGTGGTGTESNSGTYTYDTAGTLPDDGADAKQAQDMATKHSTNVNEVQAAASGLSTWAHFDPSTFGQAGDWNTSFSLMGNVYVIPIPVSSAPVIRALLLLVVQVTFVGAAFKLILSI
jgi:hypothetical protein